MKSSRNHVNNFLNCNTVLRSLGSSFYELKLEVISFLWVKELNVSRLQIIVKYSKKDYCSWEKLWRMSPYRSKYRQ